mgnify:CR=1 FL=1
MALRKWKGLLLDFDRGTSRCQVLLEFLGIFLGNSFFDLARYSFDRFFGFFETQSSRSAYLLDHANLFVSKTGQNHVEGCLLGCLFIATATSTSACGYHYGATCCGFNTVSVLQVIAQSFGLLQREIGDLIPE